MFYIILINMSACFAFVLPVCGNYSEFFCFLFKAFIEYRNPAV